MTARYPIDTATLRKGDSIAVEVIEHAMGTTRDAPDYWTKLLDLRSFVARDIYERRGEVVTLKQEGQALRVLTDEEASHYNPRMFAAAMARAGRAHYRNMGVDASGFSREEAARHERNVEIAGRMLQAAQRARQTPVLEPTRRQTPGLPESNEGGGGKP